MRMSDKKTNLKRYTTSWCCGLLLTGITPPVFSSDTATTTITATVVASCSLSAPATVDLGEIPYSAFENLGNYEEASGYDKTFTLGTDCSGADTFRLSFSPGSMRNGCTGQSAVVFCLYDSDGNKLDMNNTDRLAIREMDSSTTGVGIRVVPARGASLSAGTHNATVNITLEPL